MKSNIINNSKTVKGKSSVTKNATGSTTVTSSAKSLSNSNNSKSNNNNNKNKDKNVQVSKVIKETSTKDINVEKIDNMNESDRNGYNAHPLSLTNIDISNNPIQSPKVSLIVF